MSSISMSMGVGSSKSSLRPDNIRCHARDDLTISCLSIYSVTKLAEQKSQHNRSVNLSS
jgi:hypothetical protein